MDTMTAVNHPAKSGSYSLVETVVDPAVDRAVEAVAEEDDEKMVAVEDVGGEAELNDDRIAEMETEVVDAGCKYAKSNSSTLQGFAKMIFVL
jgi:hypothetical protein